MLLRMLLRQSFFVLAVSWAVAIPLAAFAASRQAASASAYGFALAVYSIGRVVCHQLPARSFHLWMTSLPVCARCAGIYAGAAATSMPLAFGTRRGAADSPRNADTRSLLLLALVPTAVTLVYEWTTGDMPSHWVRAGAGVPLGAAVAWAIGMVN